MIGESMMYTDLDSSQFDQTNVSIDVNAQPIGEINSQPMEHKNESDHFKEVMLPGNEGNLQRYLYSLFKAHNSNCYQ